MASSFKQLTKMNKAFPHTIAVHGGNLAGYALSMPKEFGNDIEVLRPMFREIEKMDLDSNFIVMGQICVARDFRGKGVFRGLCRHMAQFVAPYYRSIITEVDVTNTRSIGAHKALGFVELSRYKAATTTWSLIGLAV